MAERKLDYIIPGLGIAGTLEGRLSAPAFDPALRARLDPMGKASDQQLQALLAQYPVQSSTDNRGNAYQATTFQIRPDGSVAVGIWSPDLGRFSPSNVLPSIEAAVSPQTANPADVNATALGYAGLVNPYGNAYLQRLQDQLAGRSEANLQRMNALMSQRGMGGTGLAAARAMQAQSDVGQQMLEAQQQAAQQAANFAIQRMAGLTGQQQVGRQQTEAERSGLASRNIARKQFGLNQQEQQARLVGQAAQGVAALGMAPTSAPTSTGGGQTAQPQGLAVQGRNAGGSAPVQTNLEQFNKDLYYTPYVAGSRNYRIM